MTVAGFDQDAYLGGRPFSGIQDANFVIHQVNFLDLREEASQRLFDSAIEGVNRSLSV